MVESRGLLKSDAGFKRYNEYTLLHKIGKSEFSTIQLASANGKQYCLKIYSKLRL